jgi:hypothetical protein
MSECAYCECDLPVSERICHDCYAARYVATGTAKGLSRRETLQPAATPTITTASNNSPQDALALEANRAMYPTPFLWGTCLIVAGLVLYAVFTYLPSFVSGIILLAAWGVIGYDFADRSKRKARAITQYWMIGVPGGIVLILWKLTGNFVWMRLGMVAGCLMAGYIWIDRRRLV